MASLRWDSAGALEPLMPMLGQLDEAMPELVPRGGHAGLAAFAPDAIETLGQLFPRASGEGRGCLAAGLWLLADELDRAHAICQAIATPHGSAWHAVMHRREGDFGNALYWWRRAGGMVWVGPDGVTPLGKLVLEVLEEARSDGPAARSWRAELGVRGYEPAALVRLADRAQEAGDAAWTAVLVRVQRLEWASLFAEGVRAARKAGGL